MERSLHRFSRNKLAIIGNCAIVPNPIMAIFVPVFSQYNYTTKIWRYITQPPSADNWFGTDDLARDVFVRVLGRCPNFIIYRGYSCPIDLIVGVLWGSIAGLAGGRVDNIMMRIVDVLSAIPYLLVVIILLVVMEPGLWPMIIALSITGWVNMARIVRSEVLSIKNQEFVLAARTLGASKWHLIKRHLIPNAWVLFW